MSIESSAMCVFEKASYICVDFDSPMVFAFRLLSAILGSGHSQEATSGDERAWRRPIKIQICFFIGKQHIVILFTCAAR
jgi:hypothetical protein